MSIKHGILAILSRQSAIAYHVKKEFEHLTVGIWPVNDGQIYTTLQRLQRDGLIEPAPEDGADREASAKSSQPAYALTDDGRAELARWLSEVRAPEAPDRDELAIKVAFAIAGYGEVAPAQLTALLDGQRHAATASLQRLTRTKAQLSPRADEFDAQCAVLDAASARYEAELRWLEVVEARLARRPSARRSGGQS